MTKKKILIISIINIILIIGVTSTILLLHKNKNKKEITTTTSSETSTTSTTTIEETTTTTIEETTTEVITTTAQITTQQTYVNTTRQTYTQSYSQPTTKIVTQDRNEYKPLRYNVNQVITYTETYRLYENGNREILSSKQKSSKVDYSTFSATTNELKVEAQSISNSNTSQYQEMLVYVNQLRATEGASPLTLDSNLSLAATIRALEMGWSRKFDHTRPNNTQCFTVLDELGIYYTAAGENIYYYSSIADAQRAYNAWNKSPGHHENMVSTTFTKMGVGKVIVNGATYWAQMFGR